MMDRNPRVGHRKAVIASILVLYSVLAYRSFRIAVLQSTQGDLNVRLIRDLTGIGYVLGPSFALVGTILFILIATRLVALFGDTKAADRDVSEAYALSFCVRLVFEMAISATATGGIGHDAGYFAWRARLYEIDPTAHLVIFEVVQTALLGLLQAFVAFKTLTRGKSVTPSLRSFSVVWLPFVVFQMSQILLRLYRR